MNQPLPHHTWLFVRVARPVQLRRHKLGSRAHYGTGRLSTYTAAFGTASVWRAAPNARVDA